MKQGKLIVIDGIDGSGKSTQTELLKKKINCETINFPRYEDNIYGKLIKRYLVGEFGQANPYLIALAYAGDRALAKPQIKKWLDEGKIVVANRYVSASLAHLGANLPEENREEFFKWVKELEYETNKIPEPDLTIILTVDPKIGQENVQSIHGKDLHEGNLRHLEEANKIYQGLAKKETNWYVIDCMKGDQMKTPEEIQQEILKILHDKI